MNYKKIIFNYYFFVWCAFGLLLFIYSWYVLITEDSFIGLTIPEKLKMILPTIVLLVYVITFIKYKSYEK